VFKMGKGSCDVVIRCGCRPVLQQHQDGQSTENGIETNLHTFRIPSIMATLTPVLMRGGREVCRGT
jgi:hypothetical protein